MKKLFTSLLFLGAVALIVVTVVMLAFPRVWESDQQREQREHTEMLMGHGPK